MAELIYNGVRLSYISTQSVSFDPVLDPTGCDYLYTRATINLTAVVCAQSPPAIMGDTTASIAARLSHLLNTPRRGLLFQVGGSNMVRVAPSWATGDNIGSADLLADPLLWSAEQAVRDEENGPFPKASVTQIVGTESLVVSFSVNACILSCVDPTGMNNPIIPEYMSFRWTETADIDQMGMTKRTRNGKLIVRASLLVNADQMRHIVVPRLEPDMIRTKSEYTLSADGRQLDFVFVDEEQYLMPPPPAAKAEGRFTISCDNGIKFMGECSLRMWGGKNKAASKSELMSRAFAICIAKLESANIFRSNTPANKGGYLLMGSLSENLMENEVWVRLRCMVRPTKQRLKRDSAPNRLPGQLTNDPTQAVAGRSLWSLLGNYVSAAGAGQTQNLAGAANEPQNSTRPVPGMLAPIDLSWLRVPPQWQRYDDARYQIGTRGSANLLLVAAYMQDPCLRMSVLRTGTYGSAGPSGSSFHTGNTPPPQPVLSTNPNQYPGGGYNPSPRQNPDADGSSSVQYPSISDIGTLRTLANAVFTIVDTIMTPDPTSLIKDESAGEADGVYEVYEVAYRWVTDECVIQLPVGKAFAAAAIIKTAASVSRKRAEWKAIKQGAPPTIPEWLLKDTNYTAVKQQIDTTVVEPTADGSDLRYTISGVYEWVATNADNVLNAFSAVPPWADLSLWTQADDDSTPSALMPFNTSPLILEPPSVPHPLQTTGGLPAPQTTGPPGSGGLPPPPPTTGPPVAAPGLNGVSLQNGDV